MKTRPYTLKKRAESRGATRARIVRAVMELHEEVGPKGATISAIAERAGVQRLTVYRHFPDENELFQACTSLWLGLHPPPNPQDWLAITDGASRSRTALVALYTYFRATRRMWIASYRDEEEVPALQGPMRKFRGYLDAIAAGLAEPFAAAGPKAQIEATVRHAVQFATWQSLDASGLSVEDAAALATTWIRAAAESKPA